VQPKRKWRCRTGRIRLQLVRALLQFLECLPRHEGGRADRAEVVLRPVLLLVRGDGAVRGFRLASDNADAVDRVVVLDAEERHGATGYELIGRLGPGFGTHAYQREAGGNEDGEYPLHGV
jgi:hypothetical protein